MKTLPVLLFPALLSVVACNKADAPAGPPSLFDLLMPTKSWT
jgi:hypothetical protein